MTVTALVTECLAVAMNIPPEAMIKHNETVERAGFFQLEGYQTALLVMFQTICLTVACTCRYFIIWHLLKHAPSRPLNTMMLVDQTCQLLSSFIFGLFTLATFIDLLITNLGSCWIPMSAIVVHNVSLTVGGFGMAVFRLLGIRCGVTKPWRLLKGIFLTEALLVSTILIHLLNPRYKHSPITLCRSILSASGYNEQEAKNSGNNSELFIVWPLILIVLPFLEMAIYVYLFYYLYKNDQQLKEHLPTQVLHTRKRKNLITLSGQTFSFFVETTTALTIATIVYFNLDLSFHPPLVLAGSSFLAISHFLACPELRAYFDNLMSLVPWNLSLFPRRGTAKVDTIQFKNLALSTTRMATNLHEEEYSVSV